MIIRLSVLAAAAAVAVSGCSATTSGTARPAATPPLATPDSLSAMLLPAGDVGAALGSGQVAVTRRGERAMGRQRPFRRRRRRVPAHRRRGPAGGVTPEPAGPICVARCCASRRAAAWSHFAAQAVVLFPTAAAAADFFARPTTSWAGCANRELSYAQQLAPDQVWSVGPASADAGVLTVERTQAGPAALVLPAGPHGTQQCGRGCRGLQRRRTHPRGGGDRPVGRRPVAGRIAPLPPGDSFGRQRDDPIA